MGKRGIKKSGNGDNEKWKWRNMTMRKGVSEEGKRGNGEKVENGETCE